MNSNINQPSNFNSNTANPQNSTTDTLKETMSDPSQNNNPEILPPLPPFENILDKIDFEDKAYLLSIFETALNSNSESLIENMKVLESDLSSHKMLLKINEYQSQINKSASNNVLSSIKIIKIYALISLYKDKLFHSEECQMNYSIDLNLLIYVIYKILVSELDEISTNNSAELDILTNIILSKYMEGEKISFEKFKSFLKEENTMNVQKNLGGLTFECFRKIFEVLVKFFFFSDKIEIIFNLLNSGNKKEKSNSTANNSKEANEGNKIMTAELVICMNKIIRNLNENNQFYYIAHKFLEVIDTGQIYLSQRNFYLLFIKSLES